MNKLVCIFVILVCGAPVFAQKDETANRLEKLMTACSELRNPAAAPRLLVLRRELPEFARPILVLRRQALASRAQLELDEKTIETIVTRFRDAARALAKNPNGAIKAVDARRAATEGVDRDLLDAWDRALHLRVADAAIQRFVARGAWDGMFRDLLGTKRPRVARACMDLFLDRLNDAGYRGYAAQGAAELAPKDERAAWAKEALQVYRQDDEAVAVRRTALVLAKRLGRDDEFDAEVKGLEDFVAAQMKLLPGKRDLKRLLVVQEELVELLGRANLIERALPYEAAYCRLLLGNCSYETQPPEARSGIAGALYDFACRLARGKRGRAALHVLEHALSWGFSDLNWVESDPELASIRNEDGLAEKIASWRDGKKERGSLVFDPKRWDRIVTESVARKATTDN